MTTDSLLMKEAESYVRPSRKSSAMAPRAQDLVVGWGGDRASRVPTVRGHHPQGPAAHPYFSKSGRCPGMSRPAHDTHQPS